MHAPAFSNTLILAKASKKHCHIPPVEVGSTPIMHVELRAFNGTSWCFLLRGKYGDTQTPRNMSILTFLAKKGRYTEKKTY